MRPSVRERVAIGFQLSRAALAAWGTGRFWSYLSWWHEEIHYTIPAEAKLEAIFFNKDVNPSLLVIGTSSSFPSICFDTGTSSLMVSVPDSVGIWKFEGLSIQTSKKPHLLRRGVMWLVMGARWESNKSVEALPPEYDRLKSSFFPEVF